jgi:hypothetical protein
VDVLELFMQFLLFLHVVPPPIGFLFFGSSVPCPCVEGGDDGLHCGGGVKDTKLVLVVVAALSGAVRAGCDCGGGDLGTLEEYKCEILFVRGGRGAAVVVV